MKRAGTIVYIALAALIFSGFLYLGIMNGFSDGLDIGLVVVLWLFAFIAMKTRLIKVPSGTRLQPFANTSVGFKNEKLLTAMVCVALAFVWTVASVWFVHSHGWDDSSYGVALVAVPMVVFLGLFVIFLAKGVEVTTRRR